MFLYIALVDMVSTIILKLFFPTDGVVAQWNNPLILQQEELRRRWIRVKRTETGFVTQ